MLTRFYSDSQEECFDLFRPNIMAADLPQDALMACLLRGNSTFMTILENLCLKRTRMCFALCLVLITEGGVDLTGRDRPEILKDFVL